MSDALPVRLGYSPIRVVDLGQHELPDSDDPSFIVVFMTLCNKLAKSGNIFGTNVWHQFNSVGLTPAQAAAVNTIDGATRAVQVSTRKRF